MYKVENRAALDDLVGRRRPAALPAPVAAATPEPGSGALTGLVEAGRQMAAAAQAMSLAAQPQPKPRQLEAAVQRDKGGRMEKITIRAQFGPALDAVVQRDANGKLEKLLITVGQP